MSFPFEFVKKRGDYDFFSPVINFTANAALVAVGGITLATISHLSFKSLEINGIAQTIVMAIPVAIGTTRTTTTATGALILLAMYAGVVNALRRH